MDSSSEPKAYDRLKPRYSKLAPAVQWLGQMKMHARPPRGNLAGKAGLARNDQESLYHLTSGSKSLYARDDAHRAELERTEFKGKKVEVGRFKGLGEMNPDQLKQTTMDPASRSLIRVTLPAEYQDRQPVKDLVERLMGKNPEHRFNFIQSHAASVDEGVIDA